MVLKQETTNKIKNPARALEIKNSLTETYSWFGYLLALIGTLYLLIRGDGRKFSIQIIWPLTMLLAIIVYRIIGVSVVSPYQRNLYYLALALPVLSAFGLRCRAQHCCSFYNCCAHSSERLGKFCAGSCRRNFGNRRAPRRRRRGLRKSSAGKFGKACC